VTGPRLEIVVDELVVRGLRPEEARVAADALEARLTALAAENDTALPARAESFRRAAAVDVPAGSPTAVGDAVAGAVWGALSPGGGRR
jgi:hypothetical protein